MAKPREPPAAAAAAPKAESFDGGEVHDTELAEDDDSLLMVEDLMNDVQEGELLRALSEEDECGSEAACTVETCQDSDPASVDQPKHCKGNAGRRKMKVDWTPDLHRRFVQAVEQLGVEKAIPSRILDLMGVQCLTRHNIASHLQKYRSHRRHLLAREAEAATWHHRRPLDLTTSWGRTRRDGTLWVTPYHANPPHIQPRPPLAHAQVQAQHHHQSTHAQVLGPPLHVWGHPSVDHSPSHLWQQPAIAPVASWHGPDGSMWQHHTHVDAWGHPQAPVLGTPCYPLMRLHPPMVAYLMGMSMAPSSPGSIADGFLVDDSMSVPMYDDHHGIGGAMGRPGHLHPQKEILEATIREALANPCTPLPLGLRPPSMEGVMAELERQGISTAPQVKREEEEEEVDESLLLLAQEPSTDQQP
eukprot:SM000002S05546  [mRNA]  locus=s2:699888:702464:- [translate_table: standard]